MRDETKSYIVVRLPIKYDSEAAWYLCHRYLDADVGSFRRAVLAGSIERVGCGDMLAAMTENAEAS